ncbi:MAG: hypothetical protein H7X97_04295, partial [Opitutaceae bacterium]|nr:hypothetical protein [Verrucomicrobiales bacterium]
MRSALIIALVAGVAVICLQAAPATSPFSFHWKPDSSGSGHVAVEVSGVNSAGLQILRKPGWTQVQWQKLLSVFADQGDLATDLNLPPMLGRYRVEAGAIRFDPRFPLAPGIRYRAVFRPGLIPNFSHSTNESVASVYRLPDRPATTPTFVAQVYPSGDAVPENLLKFYLHFSAPMSRGHIYDHIHLFGDAGREIELPFLEIDEELWNAEMTRLTLFIDPGRIKRGVRPLEEIGPSLEAGKSYTLVLEREWRDSAGQLLKETYKKTFRVDPPDRNALDPAKWTVTSPKPGTREPLVLKFSKPMDHALAQRVIQVTRENVEEVKGRISLTDHERQWVFVPDSGWKLGPHQVVVARTIEDLAGNNIGKPFEVDLFEKVDKKLITSAV